MGLSEEVSFELAKLLKENNFYKRTIPYYVNGVLWNNVIGKLGSYDACSSNPSSLVNYNDVIAAPTIAQVVDWLYDEHGIWIGVELTDNTKDFYFQPNIWTTKDREYHDEDMIDQAKCICKWKEWQFDSREEAYEFAIKYCLTEIAKKEYTT